MVETVEIDRFAIAEHKKNLRGFAIDQFDSREATLSSDAYAIPLPPGIALKFCRLGLMVNVVNMATFEA